MKRILFILLLIPCFLTAQIKPYYDYKSFKQIRVRDTLFGTVINFSGALMPNNSAGTSGQVLVSAGSNNPPVWGTGNNIYTVNGTLAADRELNGGNNYLSLYNLSSFNATTTGGASYLQSANGSDIGEINAGGGSAGSASLISSGTGKTSTLFTVPDSIVLRPHLGQINIDSLRQASAANDSMMVWNPISGRVGYKSIPLVTSGTYTPTLTNSTNVTSSTPIVCHYTRVGNQVTVTGSAGVVTTLAVATVLSISLPVSSNFTATTDAAGVGQATSAVATNAYVQANATSDLAELTFIGLSVGGSGTLFFTFTYTVL